MRLIYSQILEKYIDLDDVDNYCKLEWLFDEIPKNQKKWKNRHD